MLHIVTLLICALCFDSGFSSPRLGGMKNVTKYTGEDASFTCTLEFSGKKLTNSEIVWQKNGETIAIMSDVHADKNKYELSTDQERRDSVIAIHKKLLIKNLDKTDTGRFTCVVLHQQHVMASAWLKVLKKVLPTPECNHSPKTPQLGDVVATSCKTATGEPPVRLRMYQLKPSGEKGMIKDGFQLLDQLRLDFNFTISRENIGDIIVCEVTILELRGLERCTIDILSEMTHGQKKPNVQVVPLNEQPIRVGETACFLCNIYDHEDVNVVWSLDGRTDVTSNISRQYQYCYNNIQLTDNGKDVKCNILSKHMTRSNSVKINVIEPTNPPSTVPAKEVHPTPDLFRLVDSQDDGAIKGDTQVDLTQIKIFLVLSLLVIIALLVAIFQLLLRSKRKREGCFKREDFARLSTISDRDMDQRYTDIGYGDGSETSNHVLLGHRMLSGDQEIGEQNNESETST